MEIREEREGDIVLFNYDRLWNAIALGTTPLALTELRADAVGCKSENEYWAPTLSLTKKTDMFGGLQFSPPKIIWVAKYIIDERCEINVVSFDRQHSLELLYKMANHARLSPLEMPDTKCAHSLDGFLKLSASVYDVASARIVPELIERFVGAKWYAQLLTMLGGYSQDEANSKATEKYFHQ